MKTSFTHYKYYYTKLSLSEIETRLKRLPQPDNFNRFLLDRTYSHYLRKENSFSISCHSGGRFQLIERLEFQFEVREGGVVLKHKIGFPWLRLLATLALMLGIFGVTKACLAYHSLIPLLVGLGMSLMIIGPAFFSGRDNILPILKSIKAKSFRGDPELLD